MTCFNDLIGVEFEYGGRGPESFDCWGLVQECHRRWHGIELPDYRSSSNRSENAAVMAAEGKRLWTQLPEIEPGAVLLLRVGRFGSHVGFAHSRTRFLQALEGFGVMESRVSRFERQIIGAYRYVGHQGTS
ncbi:MAG: C40 family peptidase [Rhodobacterales bacterium]|nr:C40 family peptidase [Rhodobacterales bacterium]